ncbi:Thymidylate kinase, partial [Ceratobasidium sp. 392]
MAAVRRRWDSLLSPWPLGGRSDSPALDAIVLSKLLWGDDSEDEEEVEDHILTGQTTLVSGTRKTSDDGTDNPDEAEVDGLIDTFDVGLPEHSFRRISSWRAGVVRGGGFDFVNQDRVLSPLPAHRKRKRSSVDLREQPVTKLAKLMVDQPICPACNSTFVSKKNLQRHGRRSFFAGVGLDRSGKSTQCAQLAARIEATGKPVKSLKFPDRTTAIGKMINAYLQSESEVDDQTIHLLFSANRWELASNIKSLLVEGITIICDRYAYSGLAFSVAKNTGLSYEWCLNPDIGLPAPDIVFFLDVAPEVARKRGGFGEERYEKEELQANVRRVFEQIGGEVQERWEVIDANRSQSEVEEELWSKAEPLIGGVGEQLGIMWAT